VNKEDLKKRTKEFALRIFKFLMALEQNKAADVISFQLLKASSSVAANYRAACRGKSSADFLNKWIASVFPAVYQLLLRHQRVKRADMRKKYFLTLDSLWLATGNIN